MPIIPIDRKDEIALVGKEVEQEQEISEVPEDVSASDIPAFEPVSQPENDLVQIILSMHTQIADLQTRVMELEKHSHHEHTIVPDAVNHIAAAAVSQINQQIRLQIAARNESPEQVEK